MPQDNVLFSQSIFQTLLIYENAYLHLLGQQIELIFFYDMVCFTCIHCFSNLVWFCTKDYYVFLFIFQRKHLIAEVMCVKSLTFHCDRKCHMPL